MLPTALSPCFAVDKKTCMFPVLHFINNLSQTSVTVLADFHSPEIAQGMKR